MDGMQIVALVVIIVVIGIPAYVHFSHISNGERPWSSGWGRAGGWEYDPAIKEKHRDYFEKNGYRWSEKYHRWYRPKKR